MEFKQIISIIGYGIETIGVIVIIIGCVASSWRFLQYFRQEAEGVAYRQYRSQLGHSIMLGLEFLVAGDIIRTVIVADTLTNVAILGVIVLIRTFLSFTLFLEVEGRWPWEKTK